MARRRDESRRRGKLDPRTLWALVGDEEVYEDADMVELYWAYREEVHAYTKLAAARPAGWWALEAPEGAPQFEDYRGEYCGATNRVEPDPGGDLWTEDFDLDRLRFLARHGQLSDDEIAAKLAAPKDDRLPPYARETAERDAEAVLDGLADRRKRPAPRDVSRSGASRDAPPEVLGQDGKRYPAKRPTIVATKDERQA